MSGFIIILTIKCMTVKRVIPWKGIQTNSTRKNEEKWADKKVEEKDALECCDSPLS